MIYSVEFEIPSNTLADSPRRLTLPVCQGTVRYVWVRWHWGSANLCGVRVYHNEFSYWPMVPGGWFYSTVHPLGFTDTYQLDSEPYDLVLEGYNTDDTYLHSVWVAFNILREGPTAEDAEWLRSLGIGV